MHFQTLYTILFCPLLLYLILLTYDLNLLFSCLLRGFRTFELRIADCRMRNGKSYHENSVMHTEISRCLF